ncbi:MAG TPA: biopolymer transporter ExbD, partial [Phycisphaerales bacterium]|nr:biopolymer transporter ExbD [Phycisphaerales bacterium]
MRFNRKKRATGTIEVVVTSLLDINFLLIMFFMMAAQFQRESRAQLNLPQEKGEAEPKPDESGVVININAKGEIIIADKTVSLEELGDIVTAER